MSTNEHRKLESLAFLWSGNRSARLKRALFFTYRFNYPWFHDHVLSRLKEHLHPKSDISIIATRFDEQELIINKNSGRDLYDLEQWASLGNRFRIRYLPVFPVSHAKFILLEFEGPEGLVLGGGSANLTSSGWMHQAELWSWDERRSLHECRNFLDRLAPQIGKSFLEEWKTVLTRIPKACGLPWLTGNKDIARKKAFDYLFDKTLVGAPRLLRIVSPFFDDLSSALLAELLERVSPQIRDKVRIEIWIDGSAQVSRPVDYSTVIEILQLYRTATVKAPFKQTDHGKDFLPLHMKAIEVIGANGKRVVFGSANFTGAAWRRGTNYESIFGQECEASLEQLGPDLKLEKLTRAALQRLERKSVREESESVGSNLVYWATYDEKEQRIAICMDHPDQVIEINVLASADERRVGKEKEKLENIAKEFSTPENWLKHEIDDGLIIKKHERPLQIPERLRISMILANGKVVHCPVEISNPSFGEDGLRDDETGVPWDLASGLLGAIGRPAIVARPLPKNPTIDSEFKNDEESDEEEIESSSPMRLEGDPGYHYEPDGVKIARVIRSLDKGQQEALCRRLSLRKHHSKDPRQQLLLEATRIAITEHT